MSVALDPERSCAVAHGVPAVPGGGCPQAYLRALVGDVQSIVREWAGRKGQPTAICIDSRTLQSTPESGARAGYDGAKRRKGSKVHIAVDTLGHLLALTVTPADQGDREQVAAPGRTGPACNRLHGPKLPLSIKATPDPTPRTLHCSTAYGSKWSSTRWQNEDSSCCPDDGWSREASPGPHAFADSPETTNGSPIPLKGIHFIAFAILMTSRLVKLATS